MAPPQKPPYRRRIKLANRRLQLRLIGVFAGLCVLALATQTLVLGLLMMRTASSMPSGGEYVVEALPEALGQALLLSLVVVLPALFVIGVHTTFRIVGPLRGIERHLRAVAGGEWPGECRVREKDELQEFCGIVNAALESARAQGAADPDRKDTAADEAA
ncbi:MAG: hypothetical protein ACI8QZ_001582 [Chlamydiales bacterium]|jgi:hypothetical protein